ncbi:DUF2635 domain-containing protein [Acidocella sp.]|uniref:DUF2635 domain-containing protein n=1 Tax=Acidocella sp. TaxID=50710 RepID=UPI00263702F8|nr:DUF2635 domain-containing protein [Acidocella sp.]
MFVKPAPDRLVRYPATNQPLPAEGADVPDDAFWLRRVRDGDVIAADAAGAKTALAPDNLVTGASAD